MSENDTTPGGPISGDLGPNFIYDIIDADLAAGFFSPRLLCPPSSTRPLAN